MAPDSWRNVFFLEQNLTASLYLEDYTSVRKDAEALSGKGWRLQRKKASTALVMLLSGDEEGAIKIVDEIISMKEGPKSVLAIMKAIINRMVELKRWDGKVIALDDNEKRSLATTGIGELINNR